MSCEWKTISNIIFHVCNQQELMIWRHTHKIKAYTAFLLIIIHSWLVYNALSVTRLTERLYTYIQLLINIWRVNINYSLLPLLRVHLKLFFLCYVTPHLELSANIINKLLTGRRFRCFSIYFVQKGEWVVIRKMSQQCIQPSSPFQWGNWIAVDPFGARESLSYTRAWVFTVKIYIQIGWRPQFGRW